MKQKKSTHIIVLLIAMLFSFSAFSQDGYITINTTKACQFSNNAVITFIENSPNSADSTVTFKYSINGLSSNTVTAPNYEYKATVSVNTNTLGNYTYTLDSIKFDEGPYFATTSTLNIPKLITIGTSSTGSGTLSACLNQIPFYWGSTKIDSAGSYSTVLKNSYGCDSFVTASFNLLNNIDTTVSRDTICFSQLPYSKYGLTFNDVGTYYQKLYDGQATYFYLPDTSVLNDKLAYLYKQMYSYDNTWGGSHSSFGQKANDIASDLMGNDMLLNKQGLWFDREYQYKSTQNTDTNFRPYFARRRYYDMLYTIKGILEAIDATTNYTTTEKEKIKGQCFGLRAYCYHYLINYFQQTYAGNSTLRGLPIIKENSITSNNYVTVQDIYNQIITDLTNAETLLTGKVFANKTAFSIGVVYGFRARVALLMENWTTAAYYANKAYTSVGTTTLMSVVDYKKGFNSIANPEWIWGSILDETNTVYYASFFEHMDVDMCTYAQQGQAKKISKYLYDKIPVWDVRKTVFVSPNSTTTYPVYSQLKFKYTNLQSFKGDYVFMRTAEMYLIEAEAKARLGQDSASKTVLETLVKSRYPAYSASSFSGATLIEEILLQRRIELWGEGFSLIDLKRTNAGLNRPTGAGNHGSPNLNPIIYTLPAGSPLMVWVTPTRDSGLIIPCEKIEKLILTINPILNGNTIHPTKGGINNVGIYYNGSISNFSSGKYNYDCIAIGSNLTLRPTKNNDITKANGVTSIDALLTQRHILNTTKLNSPYKLIAADVDGNKAINSVDVLRMKRLILVTDTTFTKGSGVNKVDRLWEFVDSAYVFPDTTNPFPFKDSISFTNLTSNKTNQTFIGVKLGDVNYDWNPAVARQMPVKPIELVYHVISTKEKSTQTDFSGTNLRNDELRIPVSVNNFKDLAAMQYTLHFDNTKYEFVGIENNKLGIDFNDKQANKTGNIAMLWTDKNAQAKTLEDGTELFTLVLRSTVNSQLLTDATLVLTNDIAEVEAWDNDYRKHNIVLTQKVSTKDQEPKNDDQFIIYPNPSKGNIAMHFQSPTHKNIHLELINPVGKILYTQVFEVFKGYNTVHINLNKNAKLSKGIYFIKIINSDREYFQKIIVD